MGGFDFINVITSGALQPVNARSLRTHASTGEFARVRQLFPKKISTEHRQIFTGDI